MKHRKVLLAALALSIATPVFACQPEFVASETVRDHYLALPGVSLYKNTVNILDVYLKCGEFGGGITAFKGLGKRDFFKHRLGNELDAYFDLRHEIGGVEAYGRISYFDNDFPVAGIGTTSDDQLILDVRLTWLRIPLLQPFVAWRWFRAVGPGSPVTGSFWWLGVTKKLPFVILGTDTRLNLELNMAFSDGALGRQGKDGGLVYWRVMAFYNIAITKSLSLIPHAILQIANGSQHGGPRDYAHDKFVPLLGLTVQKKF